MPNYDAVINITNGFNAATKLSEMNLGDMRSANTFKNLVQSPELLKESLKTIAQYSPAKYRTDKKIYERIDKGTLFLSTYQELNSKISNKKSSAFQANDFIDMARVLKPVMAGRHQLNIEKLLKIYEILTS